MGGYRYLYRGRRYSSLHSRDPIGMLSSLCGFRVQAKSTRALGLMLACKRSVLADISFTQATDVVADLASLTPVCSLARSS